MYQETGIIRTAGRHAAPWAAVVGLLLVLAGCAGADGTGAMDPARDLAITTDAPSDSPSTEGPSAEPLDTDESAEHTRRNRPRPTPTGPRPSPSVAAPTPIAPAPAPGPGWWTPTGKVSWQYHLNGSPNLTVQTDVLTSDLDATSAQQVTTLHNSGRRAICYVSAGSWEEWRSDASAFPARVLGNDLDGWPGERWLDIRQLDALLPIMERRVAACDGKGFDGIEFDNVDGYANRTGFPLSAGDQLAYNKALAALAHKYGLAVGLKNDVDQIRELVTHFDFAVNESCLEYGECGTYKPFLDAGKPVLHVEYVDSTSFCADRSIAGFSSIAKRMELDSWRKSC